MAETSAHGEVAFLVLVRPLETSSVLPPLLARDSTLLAPDGHRPALCVNLGELAPCFRCGCVSSIVRLLLQDRSDARRVEVSNDDDASPARGRELADLVHDAVESPRRCLSQLLLGLLGVLELSRREAIPRLDVRRIGETRAVERENWRVIGQPGLAPHLS